MSNNSIDHAAELPAKARNDAVNGSIRVAAIQMTAGPDISSNLKEAERLLDMAVSQGAKLAALPEYFCLMGMRDADRVAARELDNSGPIQEFLSDTARRLGIWLVGGSVPLASSRPDKIRNSCLVYDDQGEQVARYDKIHLFGLELGNERYAEEETIEAGCGVVSLESPFGRIGLSICYDLRFPELYRSMGKVDIIFAPAAFTATTGKAHWETLIRARAIENLAYVVAPAQTGRHLNGRETHGDSMIVDPWGVVLARLPSGSGVVVADMNPEYQAGLRDSLPALNHRTLHHC
ncbi:MAG TPA: carbon-nitrogen hydrolase family protein [Nitrosospira sp.]